MKISLATKHGLAEIRALIAAGVPGAHGAGSGIWLFTRAPGRFAWALRYTSPTSRKVREIALAPVGAEITEADAATLLAAAAELRRLLALGRDPLDERPGVAAPASAPERITFAEAAAAFITSREASWRNHKHARQWGTSLATYADPTIGALPVGSVTIEHVLQVLEPIWTTKNETASRVRGRCEMVTDYAHARGWCGEGNPWRLRGRLQHLLAPRGRVRQVRHHPAEPWEDVPLVMARIMATPGIGARALAFAVLTAARTGEVRFASWGEIDEGKRLWTIPGPRMKGGRDHTAPLSEPALAILREMAPYRLHTGADALVFPGSRVGAALSDMSLIAVLRRLGRGDITPHGFRSSFRDWCGEATDYPRELAEAALAHALGDKTEAAYRRRTAIERRRPMMEAWAAFVLPPVREAGNVVRLRGARAEA